MIILFKTFMQKKIPNMKTPPNFENQVLNRDVEPEPAFFDPTGARGVKLLRLRLRSKLKKSFFNCREYLFGK